MDDSNVVGKYINAATRATAAKEGKTAREVMISILRIIWEKVL